MMSPDDPAVPRSALRGRRGVRIIERRTSRSGTLSLLVATAVALAMILVWRMWRTEDTSTAFQRSLPDVQIDWRCTLEGHVFRMSGQVEPRTCPFCQSPAYAIAPYLCPVHGDVGVAAGFSVGSSGRAYLSHLRLGNGEWVPAEQQLHCPHCNRPLQRERQNPLSNRDRPRPRGDG